MEFLYPLLFFVLLPFLYTAGVFSWPIAAYAGLTGLFLLARVIDTRSQKVRLGLALNWRSAKLAWIDYLLLIAGSVAGIYLSFQINN